MVEVNKAQGSRAGASGSHSPVLIARARQSIRYQSNDGSRDRSAVAGSMPTGDPPPLTLWGEE